MREMPRRRPVTPRQIYRRPHEKSDLCPACAGNGSESRCLRQRLSRSRIENATRGHRSAHGRTHCGAYTHAHADAYAYADAHTYADADTHAHTYADADTHAHTHAYADADAYADAYTDTYPHAGALYLSHAERRREAPAGP